MTYLGQPPCDEHSAWLDSLEGDERVIVFSPIGWRWTLAMVAITKRWLCEDIPVEFRLKFLEHLERMPGNGITAEAVAHVAPACETAAKIYHEVKGSLDAIGDVAIFRELAKLNPSLIQGLELCGSGRAPARALA